MRFRKGSIRLWCVLFLALVIRTELWILKDISSVSDEAVSNADVFSYDFTLFETICSEIQYFPVLNEENEIGDPVSFENSWGTPRSYGGERSHEGCDLMAVINERGRYTVCSMTDGTVEKIGWLEQGGWRIGIRSQSGAYYYYAHLDSYEKAFEIGESIAAGQIIGQMGDSGYGKEPGTVGKFDVHLHVGIYIKDYDGTERAVNPYWFLKLVQK